MFFSLVLSTRTAKDELTEFIVGFTSFSLLFLVALSQLLICLVVRKLITISNPNHYVYNKRSDLIFFLFFFFKSFDFFLFILFVFILLLWSAATITIDKSLIFLAENNDFWSCVYAWFSMKCWNLIRPLMPYNLMVYNKFQSSYNSIHHQQNLTFISLPKFTHFKEILSVLVTPFKSNKMANYPLDYFDENTLLVQGSVTILPFSFFFNFLILWSNS